MGALFFSAGEIMDFQATAQYQYNVSEDARHRCAVLAALRGVAPMLGSGAYCTVYEHSVYPGLAVKVFRWCADGDLRKDGNVAWSLYNAAHLHQHGPRVHGFVFIQYNGNPYAAVITERLIVRGCMEYSDPLTTLNNMIFGGYQQEGEQYSITEMPFLEELKQVLAHASSKDLHSGNVMFRGERSAHAFVVSDPWAYAGHPWFDHLDVLYRVKEGLPVTVTAHPSFFEQMDRVDARELENSVAHRRETEDVLPDMPGHQVRLREYAELGPVSALFQVRRNDYRKARAVERERVAAQERERLERTRRRDMELTRVLYQELDPGRVLRDVA